MSNEINCQHIATDGDICLLSVKASLLSDTDVTSSHIGIVVDVGRDILFQGSFRVLVSDVKTFEPNKIKFVSFLTNIANELEIANILSLRDERDENAINSLLELYKIVGKKCNTWIELPRDIDNLCMEKQLSLSSLTCVHQHNIEIKLAPPGTLKGSVASVLKRVSHNILICVTSTSSLTDMMIDLEELSVSPDSGDVLVLNNMGQEGIKEYEKFFLHHESHELYCFLSQYKAFKSMASLLDLSTFYHIDCSYVGSCEHCSKPGLLRFSVSSFKEKFDIILSQCFSFLVYLKNHAAAFSLPAQHSIEELMNVLKNFETLLYDKNQRDEYMGAAFAHLPPAAIDATLDSASTIAMSLDKERMSCVKFIETIKSSLQLPVLENRDAIDKFCIKHSRNIIATLDCTWQLHGVDMEFDILLVNGAGQVREDQLLASFLVPVRHTVLFGDHLHLQPSVQSMFRRFKIKDYGIMDKNNTEDVTARLKKGGIMVGTFPISRNYYSLSPKDVYVYDPNKVIKHEKSSLTASHVAMMIGIGHRMTQPKRFSRHMVMQNSEGKLFGINGIGRIGKKDTLRKLYWIEVEDVKPKPAPSTSGCHQANKGGK